MTGRLAAWRALSGVDRRRLLELACALPLVECSLRCVGARSTTSWLSWAIRPQALRPASAADRRNAERLVQLAAIAGRRGLRQAHCLSQSLLVRALLRRRGLDAQLQIGVRKQGRDFDAHAWIELDGQTLAQAPLQHRPLQPPSQGTAALALRATSPTSGRGESTLTPAAPGLSCKRES